MDLFGPCPCGSTSRPSYGSVITVPFFSFERCRSLRRLPPSSATEGRDMELPTFRAGQYVDYSNGVIFRDFILFIPYAEIIVPTLKVVGLLPWILF